MTTSVLACVEGLTMQCNELSGFQSLQNFLVGFLSVEGVREVS